MAASLKQFFSPSLARRLADSLASVHEPLDVEAFVRDATRGLGPLALLDRARLFSRALAKHLPRDYPDALSVLQASLGPEHATDELEGVGMAPFFYMPHLMFVAEHGLAHFDASMAAQHALTKRFTAEFSIRSFLEHDPERTLKTLKRWTRDPDAHVRRLVSEGTRPRLPWGKRVRFLDENPERLLELLERLKDDPSTMVRRSVANHLNDLGKARPDLLFATCQRWLDGATPERAALVKHALRSAVKRGEAGALGLLGHGASPKVDVADARCEPRAAKIGETVRVTFVLVSRAKKPQSLMVDLVVHFMKARGSTSEKVFKVSQVTLDAGERVELTKVISLAVHTTRKPSAGRHVVELAINGVRAPLGHFDVRAG